MDTQWGLCKSCRWWQIEPTASITDSTPGQCIDNRLQSFQLSVSATSGCNRYMTGEPARADGSGAQPPTAKPTR